MNLQRLREIFEAMGVPALIRKEWNEEYLAVSIFSDAQNTYLPSARFGCIEDGQPVLTELPRGRYLCV